MNINGLKAAASKGQGFARSNAFQVILPSLSKYDSRELNVLCTNVNLPGRQIMTQERLIGIKGRKMPNGFASDDISMTFYVMNDFTIKEYFEEWQNKVINQDTFEIGYPSTYAQQVTITQLKRGMALDLPIDKFFGFNIDLDIRTRDSASYQCRLLDAYPTTMNQIELNNELDGLVQLNVQLSYRNWEKI
jgi:hypothetical protein